MVIELGVNNYSWLLRIISQYKKHPIPLERAGEINRSILILSGFIFQYIFDFLNNMICFIENNCMRNGFSRFKVSKAFPA